MPFDIVCSTNRSENYPQKIARNPYLASPSLYWNSSVTPEIKSAQQNHRAFPILLFIPKLAPSHRLGVWILCQMGLAFFLDQCAALYDLTSASNGTAVASAASVSIS